MNVLQVILNEMSDVELRMAVLEYKELSETAVLPTGVIRTYAGRVYDQVGISHHDAMNIVKNYVIETAAYKWVNQA